MNKRLLNFLSLAAYMQTAGALKQNNLPAADFFGKIYILVDPTNNEAHYLSASVYAKEGKTKEAIKSLNGAVKNGFTDVARLQSDSAFMEINKTKEYWDLIRKIGASYITINPTEKK